MLRWRSMPKKVNCTNHFCIATLLSGICAYQNDMIIIPFQKLMMMNDILSITLFWYQRHCGNMDFSYETAMEKRRWLCVPWREKIQNVIQINEKLDWKRLPMFFIWNKTMKTKHLDLTFFYLSRKSISIQRKYRHKMITFMVMSWLNKVYNQVFSLKMTLIQANSN